MVNNIVCRAIVLPGYGWTNDAPYQTRNPSQGYWSRPSVSRLLPERPSWSCWYWFGRFWMVLTWFHLQWQSCHIYQPFSHTYLNPSKGMYFPKTLPTQLFGSHPFKITVWKKHLWRGWGGPFSEDLLVRSSIFGASFHWQSDVLRKFCLHPWAWLGLLKQKTNAWAGEEFRGIWRNMIFYKSGAGVKCWFFSPRNTDSLQ